MESIGMLNPIIPDFGKSDEFSTKFPYTKEDVLEYAQQWYIDTYDPFSWWGKDGQPGVNPSQPYGGQTPSVPTTPTDNGTSSGKGKGVEDTTLDDLINSKVSESKAALGGTGNWLLYAALAIGVVTLFKK